MARSTFRSVVPYASVDVQWIDKTWLSNEEIIFVRYLDYLREYSTGDLSYYPNIGTYPKVIRSEIQICSIDLEGNNFKIIKKIIIDNPRGSLIKTQAGDNFLYTAADRFSELYLKRIPKYREKVFEGVSSVYQVYYNKQEKSVVFSTNKGLYLYDLISKRTEILDKEEEKKYFKNTYVSPDGKKLLKGCNFHTKIGKRECYEKENLSPIDIAGCYCENNQEAITSKTEP